MSAITRKPAGDRLADELLTVARRYPATMVGHQIVDIPKMVYQVGLIQNRLPGSISICDIGGGLGLFSIACALAGMNVTLIDDFSDPVNTEANQRALDIHRSFDITIVSRDVIENGIDFEPRSFDAITTFASMEHWHHSPKRLFAQVVGALRSNGVFVIGVPNGVNLLKRVTVPLGKSNWADMNDWYEHERFRGHVREPVVGDLLYIAGDMHLRDVEIIGRNWIAYEHPRSVVRAIAPYIDPILQRVPTLCSNLYLIGRADK